MRTFRTIQCGILWSTFLSVLAAPFALVPIVIDIHRELFRAASQQRHAGDVLVSARRGA